MKKYKVYIQKDEKWEVFGIFPALHGGEAINLARKSRSALLEWFTEDEIPYINFDYEEV
ncbi:hypothetical protein [Bacillus wiedmannii]|uniref:hypothetical protein n=1 Tax=Bacillus wiedmannii TaxID=1890302 RepID=UPI001C3F4412|nr:hypothetical protein [Bacillus wiedmannii]